MRYVSGPAETPVEGPSPARNPWLLCGLRAAQMALFPMAILTVFLQREVGFSVTEIMLLQGVFGLAMVLFEFPSGYLADRIGYRRCLIAAFGLWVVGWSVYGFAGGWLGVATAELLLGIGMALVSGCDVALLYESLLVRGEADDYAKWAGRVTFCGQIAEGSAALGAGLMFAWARWLPFVAEAALAFFGLLLALALVEPQRERPSFEDNLGQIRAMVRHVAIESPPLRAVVVAATVLGMASFIPVWTIQLYAVDAGVDAQWLGPVWAIANFSVAFAALASHRLLGSRPLALVVGLCTALIVAGFCGLGLSTTIWGVGFYYALTVMRGLQRPVLSQREQQLVPSRDRAGFVSLRSMLFRVVFLVVGPLVGWGVDRWGQHPVMLALALGFGLAGLATLVLVTRSLPAGRPPGPGPAQAAG